MCTMIGPCPGSFSSLPTTTYRAPDFVAAARALGVEVVVGVGARRRRCGGMGDRAVAVPLDDADGRRRRDRRRSTAARRGRRGGRGRRPGRRRRGRAPARGSGFPHNPPDAVAATRDKAAMRPRLAAGEVPQPRFASSTRRPPTSGFPCVVKPTGLSGSQGVIRADDADAARAARAADRRDLPTGPLIVEEYVPGVEVAVEGLLRDGALEVLAVFDKPDPLVGPYFEETIYVTPSRLPAATLATRSATSTARGRAPRSGSPKGPVHAEVRDRRRPRAG